MVKTVELRLDVEVLDRAERLAQARDCSLDDLFAAAIESISPAEVTKIPLLGLFEDEPELIDSITEAAMADRETIPFRS